MWLLVGFHPATWSVQITPADNTQKRVWQYIEKERKTHPCLTERLLMGRKESNQTKQKSPPPP